MIFAPKLLSSSSKLEKEREVGLSPPSLAESGRQAVGSQIELVLLDSAEDVRDQIRAVWS